MISALAVEAMAEVACSKRRRLLPPGGGEQGLLAVCEAVKDFGGRLAELLWRSETRWADMGEGLMVLRHEDPAKELLKLLQCSRQGQLALIVNIKDGRALRVEEADHCQAVHYAEMCDSVMRSFPRAWARSRALRTCTTREGDERFVRQLCLALRMSR